MHTDGLSRRSTFLLITLIVTVSTLLATAYTLWRLRTETIDRHVETANMYARAFEDHLSHSFNVIDLTLANVVDQPLTSATLTAALRHAPYLRSLAVVDKNGAIVTSSDPGNRGSQIFRRTFLPPDASPQAILRAGPPWIGRDFHDGRPATPEQPAPPEAQTLIPVLRDVAAANGQWITLAASVNPDYFLNYYSRNLSSTPGFVELLRYDGIVLVSSDSRRKPGTRIDDPAILRQMANEEIGNMVLQGGNGRTTLTAFRASRSFPFTIMVHLDQQSVLADWRREATHTLVVVFGVLLMALAMATLYFLRLQRAARLHDRDMAELSLRSAALEAAANAIIITDQHGVIEWANPAFCTMSGYTLAESVGQNPRQIIKSGKQAPDVYQNLWQTISAGKVWRGELINRRQDGSHYPEDQTITPVLDDRGAIRHFVAVKQDISLRKESEQHVKELSRHLVVVQESARRRLSGELHDRTSPNLAAIGVNLDIIGGIMRRDEPPDISARLDDVRALIEDTTASIREICADLRPPILDYAGLAAALASYGRQFQRRTGIAIRFDCNDHAARLDANMESMLFRIAQEALTNCAKHSRAQSIVLDLRLTDGLTALSVSDDGIGFDPTLLGKTTHTGGLGILTMREMAELSGGVFILESAPGRGTRIAVELSPQEEDI